MISSSSCFASSAPATSLKVTLGLFSISTLGRLFPNFIAFAPPDWICRIMNIQSTRSATNGRYESARLHQFMPGGLEFTVASGLFARIARPRSLSSAGRYTLKKTYDAGRPSSCVSALCFSSPTTSRSTIVTALRFPVSTCARNSE